jgi:glycosyltransferase involved in cell wall biosynthesis
VNEVINSGMMDFCLLVPCYNNYEGLVRSLRSVYYNSGPFLILVVDDGSKKEIHRMQLQHDIGGERDVHVLRMESNAGITRALNTGLQWIAGNVKTDLVARLDCGDVCTESRFDYQVQLMKEDPSLLLTGSWCYFRDPIKGSQYSYVTPLDQDGIIEEMYNRNVFIHPTVMYRSDAVAAAGFYPGNFELAEDYALFWTLVKRGKCAVINRFMVTCEIRKSGISFSNKGKQLVARARVVKAFGTSGWKKLGGYFRLTILFILPKSLILQLKKR